MLRSLKCGGDTELGHSARDNETTERLPKGKAKIMFGMTRSTSSTIILLGIISLL